MTPRDLVIRTLPAFGGWLAVAALALPGGSPPRGAAVALFLAAGPGAALVRICAPALGSRPAEGPADRDAAFDRHSDLLEQAMLAVLLSVCAVVLVSTVFIATHAFSGERVLLSLTLLTTLAACCPRLRATPAPGTPPKTRRTSRTPRTPRTPRTRKGSAP
ncbi:hypothetical protein AB0E75_17495 [Streptomyces griseoviridis]|uniref:Uncharacterized protein n=1 Tax=Streptomyces griseoviridis TaxID=45398 RepID=A0A918GQZ1_STRGD|nr:hypothetical protein [Streptomyces niveoruber]GGS54988.1 hypothetical protein GCM10010238_50500 [Streptomyces niveoruber]